MGSSGRRCGRLRTERRAESCNPGTGVQRQGTGWWRCSTPNTRRPRHRQRRVWTCTWSAPQSSLRWASPRTLRAVAGRLLGGAGPGGADSVSLQHWLLRFGAASVEIRLIVGDFVEWLGNGRPPWAAYRSLMSGQLIALDKQPGIRPVWVGETWQRMMVKCLLRVAGPEAKAACGTT